MLVVVLVLPVPLLVGAAPAAVPNGHRYGDMVTLGLAARAAAPRDHVVAFYEADDALVADVARFLAEGLRADEVAVVLATPAHQRLFETALGDLGLPIDRWRREGRFVCLDAAATLASLTVDGRPAQGFFDALVGGVLAGAAGRGRGVRAFGEMVGLLWSEGDAESAIALESFWNDLGRRMDLKLYCAYPATSLCEADLAAVDEVCSQHSDVVPPASYAADPARSGGEAGTTERTRLFLPVPTAARAVRRFVTETLDAWGASGLADDAALVSSELTTNAVRHASSPFRVTLDRRALSVTISVHDTSGAAPTRRPRNADALGGRGLAIVEELSSEWGTQPTAGGKVVWASLAPPV